MTDSLNGPIDQHRRVFSDGDHETQAVETEHYSPKRMVRSHSKQRSRYENSEEREIKIRIDQ